MDVREIDVATGQLTEREYTQEELDEIASQPQPDPIDQLKKQIDAIERETLMNRAVREFMLAQAEQIASAAGYTPEQLHVANLGYKKVKDIDSQIAALRAQVGEL